jgi:hypothetical protein
VKPVDHGEGGEGEHCASFTLGFGFTYSPGLQQLEPYRK